MTVPCNCCPISRCGRANVERIFDGGPAVLVANPGGFGVLPLARWSDGDISGANFTGFTTPGVQITPATSPTIDLLFAAPRGNVVGLREWNQGGGDLNDSDGFSGWTVTVLDPVSAVLFTGPMVMGNGGAPFTLLFPGPLDNVARVRLTNMTKINPGSGVSPLVREVRALVNEPVFPCRRAGVVTWYDVAGNVVPTASVTPCS